MGRLALALLLPALAAFPQVSVGVKGGVPLTDVFTAKTFINQPFMSHTQRYTFGPALEVRLPFGLGAELDALYKRFDETGPSVSGGTVNRHGSSWEFPLLAKYHFPSPLVAPYLEGGVTFHHLSDILLPFPVAPLAAQPTGNSTRTGFALGGGIEVKLFRLRVSSGVRYSHWGEELFVPSTNLADFLVGITF